MTAPDYLRPAQAAEQFGTHRDTLARWAKVGLIGRSKVGACVYYRAADIADLIASHETRRKVVPVSPKATPNVDEPSWVTEFWEGTR